MLPVTRQLLQTDLDGNPTEDVEEVIADATDDPRYLERIPQIEALLADESAPAADRFIAVSALAAWATPTGLSAVIAAAANPHESPWKSISIDRRYSVDDSFTLLAESVAGSVDFTSRFGTADLRIESVRALVRIVPIVFYDWQLSYLLSAGTASQVRPDIETALSQGLIRLSEADLDFPLGPQLADVAVALTGVDEERAVGYGHRILSVDSSLDTLRHLVGIVSVGKAQPSADFAEYIRTQGGESISQPLADALEQRSDPV